MQGFVFWQTSIIYFYCQTSVLLPLHLFPVLPVTLQDIILPGGPFGVLDKVFISVRTLVASNVTKIQELSGVSLVSITADLTFSSKVLSVF